MYKNKKIIGLIPARSGSKRIVGKNIKVLGDKPLITWTIDVAKASKYLDRIIISTDDPLIASIGEKMECEVPFMRPDYLSDDAATSMSVVLHALGEIKENFDYVVLLQPTSPLRIEKDIDNAIELCVDKIATSVVSVREEKEKSNLKYTIEKNFKIKKIEAQECGDKKIYILNGAVYVLDVEFIKKTEKTISENTLAYLMPWERSIDIDTEEDFLVAKAIVAEMGKKDNEG